MNILLVDDELDVLEGMLDGVDFEFLGFENVYTAQTSAQAMEILRMRNVDIMVTDIEMPGGSGLDLLRWVRDNDLDIVTLFCTGFAEFDYAQKAVQLHSFDYFLKPISYQDLQEHLAAAIQEAEKNRSLRHYSASLEDIRRENKKTFWRELLLGAGDPPDPGEEGDNGVHYEPEVRFSLFILSLADGSETVGAWKKYALRNMLEELLPAVGLVQEVSLPLADGDTCCVCRQSDAISVQALKAMCGEMGAVAKEHLSAWLNCFFATDVSLDTARQVFTDLKGDFDDDVSGKGVVYAAGEYQKRTLPYTAPQIKEWEPLLMAGNAGPMVAQINAYLDRLSAHDQVNLPYLNALRIDMLQMIHTILKERQINAYDLFSNRRFETLRENSLRSLDHMKRYLEYIVRTACDYLSFTKESQSVIGRVKEYINNHYSEEFSRSAMGKVVFLNSDYLARLFKKETGQSLGSYVQERRIHEAKKLLTETTVLVNEIALKVGYDNFSYFSHIFRERTGLTPNEYRKQTLSADPRSEIK